MIAFREGYIEVDPPKRPKKLTGTRFANIFDLSPWNSAFSTWCEMTKVYEEPFEDTKYTLAGKAIEPIQVEYFKDISLLNLATPEDIYGKNFFKKTYGNFFSDVSSVFGGMWDALILTSGNVSGVVEFKTSSRPQDWQEDIPEYYALQAALYAYLKGVDTVVFVCSFLKDTDYITPEKFKPSEDNTIVVSFSMAERYPRFHEDYIIPATEWWDSCIKTGRSPMWDEKRDKDILAHLRTNRVVSDTSLDELVSEIERLELELDECMRLVSPKQDKLAEAKAELKSRLQSALTTDKDTASVDGSKRTFYVKRSQSVSVDKNKLIQDGLFDQYSISTESFKLLSKNKED